MPYEHRPCGKLPTRTITSHSKLYEDGVPQPYPRLEVLYGQLKHATGEQRVRIEAQIAAIKAEKRAD